MSKKLIVAAVVAILAFGATMAMATESRVECLGGQGLYLADDTNIFANPITPFIDFACASRGRAGLC